MRPIRTTQEVYDAIQQTKAGASAFCTNFYPVPQKVAAWISQSELNVAHCGKAAFFFRRDRDFWHLYFCASNADALRMGLNSLDELKMERVVTDTLGTEGAADPLLPVLENAGLFPYKQLVRMTRANESTPASSCDEEWKRRITFAHAEDATAVLELIEAGFNRYAKSIPSPREISAAIDASQILSLKLHDKLAGALFFETQGVTSTLRYWAVSEGFRNMGVGSALMRHYLATHSHIRRFVLWVNADNHDAINKYQHYHYAKDGVVDRVLANEWIPR